MEQRPTQFLLPPSLLDASDDRAVALLAAYYQPLSGKSGGFTGGQFDAFDPSGTRAASTNTITVDDLVAVSLLSVPIPGRAAMQMLTLQRRRFETLLEDIGPDRDLATETSVAEPDFRPAWDLWRALGALPGIGPTRVSKLMARKRPRLIPIFDSVIDETVLGGRGVLWAPMHTALRENDYALHRRLLQIRTHAGLDESISAVRVFDVLAWMEGSGNASEVRADSP